MTTEVSRGRVRLTAPPGAARAESGGPRASRSTPWQLYLALALGSVLLGSLSVLYPSTPSYDPWGWLLWGREILHLDLDTIGANSFKPLPVLFTFPFALFGKAQPDLWLAVARSGAIFALAMAFKLAARLTIWFGAGPRDRTGLARVAAYGPALLAGGIAVLSIVISPEFIRDAALGYSECLGAGMVLLAIDRHLEDKPRQTFMIGFIPALDRPEIWAFWGLYGLYLWRRDPGARKLIVGLFAAIPCLWFLPELWGSGHLFRGVTRALHPRHSAATFAKCPFCTEMNAATQFSPTRVEIVTALMAVGAAIAIWRALRRRTSALGASLRELAHRPEGIVLALAVIAVAWFVEISAMTQYGFSGNDRYLIIGGALVVVVGGVGWGLVAWKLGELLVRSVGRAAGAGGASGAAGAAALFVVTGVFLFTPTWVAAKFSPHKLNHALRYQAELREDLSAVIQNAGGAKKVLACGTVETDNFEVPMVAWYLGVAADDIHDQLKSSIANEGALRHPNVILQARDTGTAPLLPKVPKSERYTEIRQRTFRLFEHCK